MIATSIKNNVSLLHRYRTIEGFTWTYIFLIMFIYIIVYLYIYFTTSSFYGVKHLIDIVIFDFPTNRLAKFSNHWEAHQVFSIHIRFRAQWPAHGHIKSKVKQKSLNVSRLQKCGR